MIKPKWQPIPGSTQEIAVDTRADQTLFAGTRGCGKTAAQLFCFRSYVGLGYGAYWCGIIFDVEYKPLEDLKAQAKKFFLNNGDGCVWRDSKADYYFEWPAGERLYLRACKTARDAENYKGHSYSFIGFNEVSKWGTSEVLDLMLATQRSASPIKGMPRLVFMTTNPDGPGVPWLKDRFVDCAPRGVMVEELIEVDVGDNRTVKVPKTKICLVGHYIENEYFTLEDIANLKMSVANNPELEAAWLRCDWDAADFGGVLGDIWKRDIHILPDFKIPAGWRLNRAFDWGSSTPFSIGWFAESDGEEFVYDNNTYCYPRGTVVMFAEWYGTQKYGTNRGLRLTAGQIALGVKQREFDFPARGIIEKGQKIFPGPADNQISDVNDPGVATIETQMANVGVRWKKSNKAKGSRRQGLEMIRQRLANSVKNEGPGFYVQRKCRFAIKNLPSLALEGEDIADGQEDHIYDMVRYRLLTRRLGVPNIEFRL